LLPCELLLLNTLLNDDQYLACSHRSIRPRPDFHHASRLGRLHFILHLHRLDNNQALAGLNLIAQRYQQPHHFSRHRRDRLLAFVNPDSDPLGKGYHILQSLIAVGSGGFKGVGYMDGAAKLFYLPEPHTDYIFATVAQELGLVGALLVVGLFIFIGWRGMRTAILSTDPFARFLAFGITATILIQAFFNISVVLALVPTKGITLPFISYGGTSLFIMLVLIGVLLNVTKEVE